MGFVLLHGCRQNLSSIYVELSMFKGCLGKLIKIVHSEYCSFEVGKCGYIGSLTIVVV